MPTMTTVKPIKTDADYAEALRKIELLFDAEPDTPEGDQLDVLATLVEAYEEHQGYGLPLPDPIKAIQYHMESRGLSTDDVSFCFGDRHTASNILQRKDPLSLDMIRSIHRSLGIPVEILIQQYPLEEQTA